MSILAGVPVKRFYVAKRRLGPMLDAQTRSQLGMALAQRTLSTIAKTGAEPLVLAADDEVVQWAQASGWPTLKDQGSGLNAAAAAAARLAADSPWMIIHADLPLLRPDDLDRPFSILRSGGSPIAPSNDGGTSLIGGHGNFRFSYGAGSFHRHLARLPDPEAFTTLGLSLDVDDPSDLIAAAGHAGGEWLGEYAGMP